MRLINERFRGAGIIEIVQCCGGDQVNFITSQPRSSEAHPFSIRAGLLCFCHNCCDVM